MSENNAEQNMFSFNYQVPKLPEMNRKALLLYNGLRSQDLDPECFFIN